MRIIRKKCLELNVMRITKPCKRCKKMTVKLPISFKEENIKMSPFPQIISSVEIYSFIKYLMWLEPGRGT